jgi:hypothetical protein
MTAQRVFNSTASRKALLDVHRSRERPTLDRPEARLLPLFVSPGMDDPVWVPTVFTKKRDRLLEGEIAQAFFSRIARAGEEASLQGPRAA